MDKKKYFIIGIITGLLIAGSIVLFLSRGGNQALREKLIKLGQTGQIPKENNINMNQALIIMDRAENVRFHKLGGTVQVMYNLSVQYPANDVINAISRKLKEMGWNALEEDYLNPGILSSHVTGWYNFIEQITSPPRKIYQWMADWQNAKGDIVRYLFRYSYIEGRISDLKYMEVIGIFIPSDIVNKQQQRRE